eukprot:1349862-Amorphochlora_amoeboformis.AAC.2
MRDLKIRDIEQGSIRQRVGVGVPGMSRFLVDDILRDVRHLDWSLCAMLEENIVHHIPDNSIHFLREREEGESDVGNITGEDAHMLILRSRERLPPHCSLALETTSPQNLPEGIDI